MSSVVTVSPKYQVVIPKEVRKQTRISPGNKFHVVFYDGQIRLVPLRTLDEMVGFIKGAKIDQSEIREKEDPVIWK